MKLHMWLNHCKNVEVSTSALGAVSGTGELHVVLGTESGCNSLRPPAVQQPTDLHPVPVERLDDVSKARGITRVDFIKLDVEGAELSVLQGARELLTRSPRPVILAEVQDIRTRPWDYRASEIIHYLADKGYKWFSLSAEGALAPLDVQTEAFDGNFVACPEECVALLDH